jgi:hypothetical protein
MSNISLRAGQRLASGLFLVLLASLASSVAAQESDVPEFRPLLRMPGKSYQGELPPLTPHEMSLSRSLRGDVERLASEIGERNLWCYQRLVRAARFLENAFRQAGYQVDRQEYRVRGRVCWNVIAEHRGTSRAQEIIVVGAHYDSAIDAPGANDNASAVAATLALARDLAGKPTARTVRFVAFTNEEPPFFQTEAMGSLVYAKRCKDRGDNIVGVLCLETIGYYSDEENSQKYPPPFSLFYPSTGNFIACVANVKSAEFVQQVARSFRQHTKFPCEGCALPEFVTGVDWSDHWSFWQVGYPAVMITDTAPFRYPHYHTREDTPDKLDYQRMARVVAGLERVLDELAASGTDSD